MIKANGVHHIAVMTADIKSHIAYFSDVLGCRLVGLFDMHGVPGAFHAFMHLNDHSYFSIVQTREAADVPIEIGKTHAGTGAGTSAPGTMQHIAFNVDAYEDLLAIRDRIRAKGVNAIGPIDHGLCHSIYFAGPDQMTLEVATSTHAIDPALWIDPAVLAKAGISPEEAARYVSPDPYAGQAGGVPQPAFDPAQPHQAYPRDAYLRMLATSDEIITKMGSYPTPPNVKPVAVA